jgi:ribonuclease E
VGRRNLGTGRGRNKKEAEQAAARDALEKVQEHPSDRLPEPPRLEEPRAAAPAPPEGAGLPAEVDEVFEGPRRRRGRRGGRGRRGRPDESLTAGSAETPSGPPAAEPAETRPPAVAPSAAARPATPKGRPEPRRPRAEPPAYVVEPPLPEVEPLPPAYEEDENEEVGRPEGPLEERHVDPYAVGEEPAGRTPVRGDIERGGGRSVEPGFQRPERAARSEPEDEWPLGLESEADEPDAIDLDVPAAEPASEEAPEAEGEPEFEPDAGTGDESGWTPAGEGGGDSAPQRDEPRFGRRPGRGRRGR